MRNTRGTLLKVISVVCLVMVGAFGLATGVEAGTTDPQGVFKVSMDVSPAEVYGGQKVTITVTMEETAGSDGVYEGVLKINGEEIDKKSVRVNPKATGNLVFEVERDTPGTYAVTINDTLEGEFTVLEGEAPKTGSDFPMGAVIGGAAGVVVLGLGTLLFLNRKKSTA
ncbi:MAG: LPXTG cell wall anchor domain-containing protein [Syntrophobacterales bacterium]|jgi:LPXTG-motif cell wall-anchored protein